MVRGIQQEGADALCLNLRGCDGRPPQTPQTYHSGKTDDLETAVAFIKSRYRYQNLGILGFSLGGNLVLKYAGEKQRELPLNIPWLGAIAVPFDLQQVVHELDRPAKGLFRHHFLRTLKRRAIRICRLFPNLSPKPETLKKVKTLKAFDEAFTAPVHGFEDAEDYYRRSSCKPFLSSIARPALVISAGDDPFIPANGIPRSLLAGNPNITLLEAKEGGHLGFGEWLMPATLWHERACRLMIRRHQV